MSEDEVGEMFSFADKDNDGKISYLEFQTMINPPKIAQETNNNDSKAIVESVKKVTIVTDRADSDTTSQKAEAKENLVVL